MLSKQTLTGLIVLATSGCAGWHLSPKEAATRSSQETVASDQSEVRQFDEGSVPRPDEKARIEYERAVIAKVKENWVSPTDTAAQNVSCDIRVQQFADGEVLSAEMINTCGSPALDGSIIRAFYRASPLPRPTDPSLFDRELRFKFLVP